LLYARILHVSWAYLKQTEPTRKAGTEQQENVRRGQERSDVPAILWWGTTISVAVTFLIFALLTLLSFNLNGNTFLLATVGCFAFVTLTQLLVKYIVQQKIRKWPGLAQKKDPKNLIPGDKAKNKFLGIIVTSLCNILIVSLLLISPGGLSSFDIQFLYLFVFPDILAAFFISARSIFVIVPINCIFTIILFYLVPKTPDLVYQLAYQGYRVILGPIIAQASAGIILYLLARKPSFLKRQ
jgi:hypothetical protein